MPKVASTKIFLLGSLLLLTWLAPGRTKALIDDTNCTVLSSSDDINEFHSLRRKVENGFNRQTNRACVERIEFGPKSYKILLSKTLSFDNTHDLDCGANHPLCNDGWAMILDGSKAQSLIIDASNLPAGTCAIRLRAHQVLIKNLQIRVKRFEDAICDEGEDNVLDDIEIHSGNDSDEDGHPNDEDNCPTTYNPKQINTDHDGQGDLCDQDDDNDGLPDSAEECSDPLRPDSDSDGHQDGVDNCPCTPNAEQHDWNENGIGDACDDETPPDPTPTPEASPSPSPSASPEASPSPSPSPTPNATPELGADQDGDEILDDEDNCPELANFEQLDADNDGLGDACDPEFEMIPGDIDGDGTLNESDNCENITNADQADFDDDGIGDACDTDIALTKPERFGGFELDPTSCRLNPFTRPISGDLIFWIAVLALLIRRNFSGISR